MKWKPQEGGRVHLVTLDGSKPVQTFTTPAFSYVHCGNAYESEDGGTLHVDLSVFESPQILNDLKLQAVRSGPEQGREVTRSEYMRLDIPLDAPCYSGSLIHIPGPRPLIPDAAVKHVNFVDFPSIHPGYKSKLYRYVYTTCAVRPTNIGNGLSKLDLHDGDVKVWHHPGGVTGEPHFIPRPDAAAEDDGIVLSSCVDDRGMAFLLMLDARSWEEVARAQLPYPTPYRFHGVWLPR
jgi:carlactone synthase/all-trans-10'-apo-beta-carotenal 13,14-cleaving dioxygenase